MGKGFLPQYYNNIDAILAAAAQVEGMMRARELKFLVMAALCRSAEGCILEIGSFKGQSTVTLAKAATLLGEDKIYATDPFDPAYETTPEPFHANLQRQGVDGVVEFTQLYSHDLAKTWDRKIRFLWIDGDHSYEGVRSDVTLFEPFLTPGAILASHDILSDQVGAARAFGEYVLLSDKYGAAGVCGSIGWAQYVGQCSDAERAKKRDLAVRLGRLAPYADYRRKGISPLVKAYEKHMYKIMRWNVPHGFPSPEGWLKKIGITQD
ncbi:MAG: class I SAM-dependent methyltransferase [Negativicutes bacterium]|nr:class I SAM-dependent methyltransferase [Negativicutes bacterium]